MTKKLLLVLLGAGSLLASTVEAQTKTVSIQGVWQVVEVTMPGSTPATITIPEPRPNLTIVTARHYSRVQVDSDVARSMPANIASATADELRAVWGPFVGEAGTYEISDTNVITMRPIVAKNPAAMQHGAFTTWSYKLEGHTLWVTAKANQNGPVDPVTVKCVRVE